MAMAKLQYRNNWESDEYYVDDTRILELKKVRIGKIEYPVKTRKVTVPYYDSGHQYESTSDHYFIEASVFGIKMDFDLNKITNRTTVFALDYKIHVSKVMEIKSK